MDDLLTAVLDAHGGLQNWARVGRITARISLGGPFWEVRGWKNQYVDTTVTLDPHRQHIRFASLGGEAVMSVLDVDPERVVISTLEGRILEERTRPRDSFPRPFLDASTRWDAIQVAYFTSAAVWNYLTAPFVFVQPGVETREIDPWIENAQTWRRLAVAFPQTNANHNARQVFYFDDRFMLRRLDYSPDVTGNPPVAHYCHDPKTFDGLVFPTRRLVHLHDERGIANQEFAPITMGVTSVALDKTSRS